MGKQEILVEISCPKKKNKTLGRLIDLAICTCSLCMHVWCLTTSHRISNFNQFTLDRRESKVIWSDLDYRPYHGSKAVEVRVWYPRKPVYALLVFCHFRVMELTEHPYHISDITHKCIEHPPSVDHDNNKFRSKSTRYGAQL